MKCPYRSETRLFRTRNSSLEECHQLCYDTEDCQYFTIGVSSYTGVCIGCTEDAQLTPQDGMDSYEMTVLQDFPTASPVAASSCLLNGDSFTTEGCDYESFVQGLDEFLEDNTCGDHDADAVLESLFPNSSPKDMIDSICDAAWDQVPTSTFQHVDERFTDEFMEDYINGDTFLNRKFYSSSISIAVYRREPCTEFLIYHFLTTFQKTPGHSREQRKATTLIASVTKRLLIL